MEIPIASANPFEQASAMKQQSEIPSSVRRGGNAEEAAPKRSAASSRTIEAAAEAARQAEETRLAAEREEIMRRQIALEQENNRLQALMIEEEQREVERNREEGPRSRSGRSPGISLSIDSTRDASGAPKKAVGRYETAACSHLRRHWQMPELRREGRGGAGLRVLQR